MHIRGSLWPAGLLLCSLANCTPNPIPNPSAQDSGIDSAILHDRSLLRLECLIVDVIVKDLKTLGAKASSFCSSFNLVPLATSVVTSSVTFTPSPVTISSTVTPATVIISTTFTTTDTTVTTTKTTYSPLFTTLASMMVARDRPPIPSYIPKIASAELSMACSCLIISTSTTTVTTTVSTTLPVLTVSTTTTIATPTTVATSTITADEMAETVITEFCDPKNYINSTGGTFVDAVILEADVDSKLGCCLACFYTENCFTYRWLTFYSQVLSPCVLYALAEAQDFPTGVAGARCPLGLVPGDFLVSQTDPNTQYEYGICAEKAILS